jgi:hypothetical protein
VSLEGRKVMEVEERLKNKEILCLSLSEDKASLKSLLSLQEDERRAEGRQFENKIADSMAKIAEENIRLKERSLAQLKESSLKEQQGLREKIQQLETAVTLAERNTEIVRMYVTHRFFLLITVSFAAESCLQTASPYSSHLVSYSRPEPYSGHIFISLLFLKSLFLSQSPLPLLLFFSLLSTVRRNLRSRVSRSSYHGPTDSWQWRGASAMRTQLLPHKCQGEVKGETEDERVVEK